MCQKKIIHSVVVEKPYAIMDFLTTQIVFTDHKLILRMLWVFHLAPAGLGLNLTSNLINPHRLWFPDYNKAALRFLIFQAQRGASARQEGAHDSWGRCKKFFKEC